MAAAVADPFTPHHTPFAPVSLSPLKVCFSYAAYAKNLINYLYSFDIPVDSGLSEAEFAAVEEEFGFTFPPDLRSILQEGLPVGPGFPNWRSSSKQQLEILISLPVLGICKDVSRNELWFDEWGDKPDDGERAARIARGFLKRAPILVPIYRQFYIPAAPCSAGNPVFHVCRGEVRLWSFDIAGFFQKVEFCAEAVTRIPRMSNCLLVAPAWAAREGRRIEVWTEMAEGRGRRRWWSGALLGGRLEEVWWRLRDGGWTEEEVREMMMMDGGDELKRAGNGVDGEQQGVGWRVRAVELLRVGGWSAADVVELLGDIPGSGGGGGDGDSCFEFHYTGEMLMS